MLSYLPLDQGDSEPLYSRMKISKNQQLAKADAAYLVRESRHCGLALGMDSLKHTSVDVDMRVLTDYLILKSPGIHGLPRDFWFLYQYIDSHGLRMFKPHEFAVLTKTGSIGLGVFEYPKWHKEEGENILKKLDIEIEKILVMATPRLKKDS